MDQKMNIPPYIIKQMIASTLYERKNDLVQKVQAASQKPQRPKSSEYHTLKNYIETAINTQDMAREVRLGNIPLDQCIAELTEEERKVVYHKCKDWYEKNKIEEKER